MTEEDRQPHSFVGREDELLALERWIVRDRSPRAVAVLGGTGSGKTTLLHQFVRRHRGAFPGGIEYLSPWDRRWPELEDRLGQVTNEQVLLVIDEADGADWRRLAPYLSELRERPYVQVLLACQRRLEPLDDGDLDYVVLPPMNRSETKDLVSSYALPGRLTALLEEQSKGVPLTAQLLASYARETGFQDVIEALGRKPLATILGPDGRPLNSTDKELEKVEVAFGGISDAVIRRLAAEPERMYEISPRRFEELVAELYHREGYEVELTPVTGDGGIDVYAVQRTPFGSFLTVIDCKRHRKDRPVGVGLVRQLYGAVEASDASVGVLATTSRFTKNAREFQEEREFRLGLQDFLSIHEMLRRQGGETDARTD